MELTIGNLPDLSEEVDKGILRSRILNAVNDMLSERYGIKKPCSNIIGKEISKNEPVQKDDDAETESKILIPVQEPKYFFDQIVLEDKIFEELQYAVKFETVQEKVYTEWGLQAIEPSPKLALNFHGDSGTGKTMAAHALAHVMGKKIIPASYAEIESKYHGDGPKNVKKIFQFATENNAVLFIDEADSLLSKRLTNVTQGSEQAINSMRSQLLIEIENFTGIVIFATNLAVNYDSAFITRIKSIHFKKPDGAQRKKLWEKMLLPSLPLASDINTDELAGIEDACGRDIKNAMVKAAIKTAINGAAQITQQDLSDAINEIITSNKEVKEGGTSKLSDNEKIQIGRQIRQKLRKGTYRRVRQ
jgi:ATP-dependent 26S proteasome regulatory subunit